MEAILDKLKHKPSLKDFEPVEIILEGDDESGNTITNGQADKQQPPLTTIVDRRADHVLDRATIMSKLQRNMHKKNIPTVFNRPVYDQPIKSAYNENEENDNITVAPQSRAPPLLSEKPKKIKKIVRIRSEDDLDDMDANMPLSDIISPPLPVTERITKAPVKGYADIGTEILVKIGDTAIIDRLPKPRPQVNIRADSYYMNNREKFVSFINSIFEPYHEELETKENITCDNLGAKSTGDLLTHQKIVRDYMNLYTPYRGLLVQHSLGSGKCVQRGTPIIMHDGSIKKVETIVTGDMLMGDDSAPRKVLSIARGQDLMYDVIPVKGDKYTVNSDHILCLKASGFPKLQHNQYQSAKTKNTNFQVQWVENNKFCCKTWTFNPADDADISEKCRLATNFYENLMRDKVISQSVYETSVKDYLTLPKHKRGLLKGYRTGVDFPHQEVPLDPYMFGFWLGDGTSARAEITTQDSAVLHYFNKELPKYKMWMEFKGILRYELKHKNNKTDNPFRKTLHDLNVYNNKHIPDVYKYNSREVRLQVLAGLIDSDGHCHNNNNFEFTQKNEKTMDDVIYLARSLGFACYKAIKKTSWTYKDQKNEGTAFRITISGDTADIPTKIPRKRATARTQSKDHLVTGITIKPTKVDDYYGFTIDGNGRFLLGDFTVTHNTATSIAVAEGMKEAKRVVILTPASLRMNYIEELKRFGDELYRKNQYWEWIALEQPHAARQDVLQTLSRVLNLPMEYITRRGGAWLVNIKKPANFGQLTADQKKSVDDQLNEMIQAKYTFINYNGLRYSKLRELTADFTQNLFDDSVVIIDEAHNLISRIVNKIKIDPAFAVKKDGAPNRGPAQTEPRFISTRLYADLMSASNARIVLLSGTPIINYPNEFAILFNILRGYIKTWRMQVTIKTTEKVTTARIREILQSEKTLDYVDYSASSKTLTVTRNPFGFRNVYRGTRVEDYKGVGVVQDLETSPFVSDQEFEQSIARLLGKHGIEVILSTKRVTNYKALPDDFEGFAEKYINPNTKDLINADALKRRILGLTSYYRSAQMALLPRYEKRLGDDYHIIRIPMSDFQFGIYETARASEREKDKNSKKPKKENNLDELYEQNTSTYRIFSRLYCNYVMNGRPAPTKEEQTMRLNKKKQNAIKKGGDDSDDSDNIEAERDELEVINAMEGGGTSMSTSTDTGPESPAQEGGDDTDPDTPLEVPAPAPAPIQTSPKTRGKRGSMDRGATVSTLKRGKHKKVIFYDANADADADNLNVVKEKTLLDDAKQTEDDEDLEIGKEGEIEGDEILDKLGGLMYKEQIQQLLQNMDADPEEYLSKRALETHSPKFLTMLENIQDPQHAGLHLVYSQFRTLEGIGIFSLVLDHNGFTRFRLSKAETTGQWKINIDEIRERGYPTYALYTGTETAEEKEIIRNIYNGDWDFVPTNLVADLRSLGENNNMGEVIKVFMITSSGSEGINLRNTRYVHIMEPYWHPVRAEQVIGRARRICSHKGLPEELRTVEVFMYLMVFTEEQLRSDKSIELRLHDKGPMNPDAGPVTSDQYLFEVSEIKARVAKQLIDVCMESAFDCFIYGGKKCVNFTNPGVNDFTFVPDYAKQENDTTAAANMKRVEWAAVPITIAGVEYAGKKVADGYEIYDMRSYQQGNPVQVGMLETKDGRMAFTTVVR